jgi:hypothetical protein
VKLDILNTSVVVLAKHHNPTILHPSFLASESIVPSDWETVETVCTPVFAIVRYKNGIVFNVEENKFQVTDNKIKDDLRKSQVSDLACKYAEKLPHVHYNAVGVNFNGFIECAESDSTVIRQFLKRNSANFNGGSPQALGLRLVYNLPDARLRLSLDGGKVNAGTEKERSGILVNANYHMDLPDSNRENRIKGIQKATSLFTQHYDNFIKVTGSIFPLEA